MNKPTPGPWRWEVSRKSRQVHLCGGVPRFDLTVVDFVRWGMGGASPRFREDIDGFNVMERIDERAGWIVPFPGREHHADWCATIDHPDARLIAAAPEMLAALDACKKALEVAVAECGRGGTYEHALDLAGEAIVKARGGA